MIILEWLRPLLDSIFGIDSWVSTLIIDLLFVLFWAMIAALLFRFVRPLVYRILRLNRKLTKKIKKSRFQEESAAYAIIDEEKQGETIARALISVFRFAILFIILMIVLKGFGIDITVILASAGVVGVAVAFGTQAVVKDFISGIFLLSEKTFLVGELVQIDGFTGTVKEIGLRTTKIEDWKGTFLIINNGNIGSVINYSRDYSLAIVDIILGSNRSYLEYADELQKFCVGFGKKDPAMVEELQFLGTINSDQKTATYRFTAKCVPLSQFTLERKLRAELLDFCQKKDWILSYPKVIISQENENGK